MKSDIIIIGGGIIGLYSAYLLTLQGIKPTVIDKGDFGKQSSWAAGGILTPLLPWNYHDDVLYLTNPASSNYQQLSQRLIDDINYDIELWTCGLTVLTPDVATVQQWCDKNKVSYKSIEHTHPSIHLPDTAQVRTPRLIKGMVAQLKRLGVKLLPNTTVTYCHIHNNKVTGIDTSSGFISTPTLIWSAGAWTPKITNCKNQFKAPSITPIKGQMIAMQGSPIKLSSILYKDGHYLIPRKDGLILAGSTLEDVGYDNSISAAARNEIYDHAVEMMPELANAEIIHQWAGLRPGSKNSIPTIGLHPEIEGLIFNCGHFRYGVAMAPKSSQIVAEWVCNDGRSLTDQERSYSQIN